MSPVRHSLATPPVSGIGKIAKLQVWHSGYLMKIIGQVGQRLRYCQTASLALRISYENYWAGRTEAEILPNCKFGTPDIL